MKNLADVKFSVLDLAPITEASDASVALQNSLSLAQTAESLGFTRYWVAEHHNMPGIASSATAVVIGHLAAGTRSIRVGSGGVMLTNHSPLVIAEQFGTLESLFPGRIDLGLGRAPGTDARTARALRRVPERYGEDFPELVDELVSYFEPREVNPGAIHAVPGEGLKIPIWLLGSSDFSARLAAQKGLPFGFASHFAPLYTIPAIELYRRHFQPSADLAGPYVMVGANVVLADTDEDAAYLATSMQQQVLNLMRGRPGRLQPPIRNFESMCTAEERGALQSRSQTTFVGTPDSALARLAQFIEETDADEVIVSSQVFSHEAREHSYKLLAQWMKG